MTKHLRLGLALTAALAFPARTFAQAEVVEYYHLDALGTVRAVTNEAGVVLETHNYLPFGEELCPSGGTYVVCGTAPAGQPKRFTGKERDAETGLDYFGARYLRASAGRFTTIDPVYTWQENLEDPQRWNRYAYVRNNPLKHVDPDGRALETPWDVANVAMGIGSLGVNIATGNFGGALADVAGLVYDGAATVVPGLPGGAGAAIRAARAADKAADVVRAGDKAVELGRAGKQARLRELVDDPKLPSADRGWIQQEVNQIARGKRKNIRNPPGKDLAHERGREAAKGYDYKHSNLQDRDLHKLQHRYDDFGKANKERPPGERNQ